MSEVDSVISVDYHFPVRNTTAAATTAATREVKDAHHLGPSFATGPTDAHYMSSAYTNPSSNLTTHNSAAHANGLGLETAEPVAGPASFSATSSASLGANHASDGDRPAPAIPLPSLKRKSKIGEDLFYTHSQDEHLKQSSYKYIAPLPSLTQAYYDRKGSAEMMREDLPSPVPVVRSSLFPVTPTSSLPPTTTVSSSSLLLEPSSPYFKASILSPAPSDHRANAAGSESTSSDLESCPSSPMREPSKSLGKIPLEDVMALREFLRQVDLRHYGFQGREERSKSLAVPSQHSSGLDSLFKPKTNAPSIYPSLRDDSYYNTEDDMDMTGTKLSSRSSYSSSTRVPPSPTSSQASISSPLAAKLKAIRKTSSPLPTSHSNNAVHVPYRGKHGPNPVCASCRTTKTPYWRDAWHQGILLCNACGLRFAKFKRRCTACHYVPRKDDKGNRCCPLCKGSWTQ